MNKIMSLAIAGMLLISFNLQAKEYLGFNLGQDTFEKITEELNSKKIEYTIEYKKNQNKQDISDIPILCFTNYPTWQKYGKVEVGELHFFDGKLAIIHVGWKDKGDSILKTTKNLVRVIAQKAPEESLFKNLDVAFRKKYELKSLPEVVNNITQVFYKNGTEVEIGLRKGMEHPTRNPLDSYYVTTVTYWDNALENQIENVVKMSNKLSNQKIAEERNKHDPDLQFAQDF